MEIVSEQVHRVLAYVEALNRHGVRPARQVVNEFARKPDLTPTKRVNQFASLSASILQSTMWGLTEKVEGETFCQYLARLSWIEDKAQVELSVIGRALLKALNSPTIDESAADVFEIVLGPNNPFAYVQALQALSIPKNALLVEPYFRLEQLMDIAEFDNIKRVLVGPGLKMKDLELLATGLAALPIERSLEIRVAEALHDRYLIPSEEGSVTMLGMSLGGIGKKVSTITTVGGSGIHRPARCPRIHLGVLKGRPAQGVDQASGGDSQRIRRDHCKGTGQEGTGETGGARRKASAHWQEGIDRWRSAARGEMTIQPLGTRCSPGQYARWPRRQRVLPKKVIPAA